MKLMANKYLLFFLLIASATFAQQKDSLVEKKSSSNLSNLVELRDQLDDYFNDPNFSNATWGVIVKSLKTGEVLYRRNADKLFIPASNMKLFTSAAALVLLGSEFMYETNIFGSGDLEKGVLKGDLIIQGSGDPTISNRFDEGYPTKIFERWADTLKAKGIWVVSGNLLGDDSYFDHVGIGKGWLSDYESEWFAPPSGALSFNDNCIEVKIEPSIVNFPAKVSLIPYTKYFSTTGKITTVSDSVESRISVKRLRGTNQIEISGVISQNSKPVLEDVSVTDPTAYFMTMVKEVFERKGIVIQGHTGSLSTSEKIVMTDDLTPLYVHKSVPLKKIIKELNKNSNNFYGEQILKTIGLEIYNYGTVENGVKACQEIFSSMGINTDNMIMADGSGLSRLDLVTPRQIINLLTYMHKNDEFTKFYESLPIAGVDGTLIDRMKRTSAENNVRAKAGYSNNVSSLSGYLKTAGGEMLAFSMIVNNYLAPSSLVKYLEDNVCQRLVNFNRN